MGMLEDLGDYIDTNTSLTVGTNLFLSLMPETVGNCVALIEHAGAAGMYTQGTNGIPIVERPQVQFIVRDVSYATGRSLAETIYRLLTAITNQTIGSTPFLRVQAVSAPALMDRDTNRRSLFTCNFDVLKVPV